MRQGAVRLIDIADFDLSACGGTHVSRTGAIGVIAVSGMERFRGGSRVTFLCGRRALAGFRVLRDAVAESVRVLSVSPSELPAAIERLQSDAKALRRQVKGYQEQVASSRAEALASAAENLGAVRAVLAPMDGWDANGLKLIASDIVERSGFAVVLVTEPPPSAVVVARSRDVAVDAGETLKALVSRFGGKGGGRPELAQGGGIGAPPSDVLAFARELLRGAQN
jgi:alanyl-tRNA synthetase